jgi:exodeoxyribonuclease VII large subunit
MTELSNSQLAWHVQHIDVQVQGARAEAAICAALGTLAQRGVDVIALVRGGGSRTDLMAFDSELVARSIAASATPVFTGIGHETDRTIADEVAHSCFKTPTACAHELVALLRHYVRACETTWQHIDRRARTLLDLHDETAVALAHRVAGATNRLLASHRQHSRHLAERIASETNHALSRAATRLDRHRATAAGTGRRALRRAATVVDDHRDALGPRVGRAMARAERDLERTGARVRAHDPVRLLARGFSVSRRPDGSVVRHAASLSPGDDLLTTFADGTARTRVEGVDLAPHPATGED